MRPDVVTGRELSLEEIRQIRDHIPDSLESETFVHGAMCTSLILEDVCSAISSPERDANQGAYFPSLPLEIFRCRGDQTGRIYAGL